MPFKTPHLAYCFLAQSTVCQNNQIYVQFLSRVTLINTHSNENTDMAKRKSYDEQHSIKGGPVLPMRNSIN